MSSSSDVLAPERPTGAPVPPAAALTACGGTPVAALLARLGAELAAQARSVEALHEAVAGAGLSARARGGASEAAQSVDLVSQHLRAVAGLLDAVAALPAVRASAIVAPGALIAALPLSALAARLRGETPPEDEAGAFDLF